MAGAWKIDRIHVEKGEYVVLTLSRPRPDRGPGPPPSGPGPDRRRQEGVRSAGRRPRQDARDRRAGAGLAADVVTGSGHEAVMRMAVENRVPTGSRLAAPPPAGSQAGVFLARVRGGAVGPATAQQRPMNCSGSLSRGRGSQWLCANGSHAGPPARLRCRKITPGCGPVSRREHGGDENTSLQAVPLPRKGKRTEGRMENNQPTRRLGLAAERRPATSLDAVVPW